MTVAAKQMASASDGMRSRQRWRTTGLMALVGAAGFAAMLLRRPGGVTHPGMWAEDGSVFMFDALTWPFTGAVWLSYGGYLLVVPRTLAAIAAGLPLAWTPTVYAVSSISLATLALLPALSDRLAWLIPSRAGRVALFALLVALPNADEVHGVMASIMWYFAIALLLLALARDPRTWWGRAVELVALVPVGLTGPMAIIGAPLFWLRAWRERTRHSAAAAAVVTATAAVQAWVVATSHAAAAGPPGLPRAGVLADVWGLRLGGTMVFGQRVLSGIWDAGRFHGVFWLLSAAVFALVFLALLRLPRPAALVIVVALAAAVVSATLRMQGGLSELENPSLGGRYMFFPLAVIAVLLVAAVSRVFAAPSLRMPKLSRGLAIVPALLLVQAAVLDFRLPPRADIHWANTVDCVRSHQTCKVQLDPAGFTTTLPPL